MSSRSPNKPWSKVEPIAEVVERLRQQARKFEWDMAAFSQRLKDAPDDNAKCRILFGVDVPTLMQHNHGEFDD